MAKAKKDKQEVAPSDVIKAFKGFEKDWSCRGFQFELGKTYVHDGEAKLCESGFHACEYPLDIFNYYPPTGQIAECELSGLDEKREGDSKRAGKSISIKASLTIPMLISAAIEFTTKHCDPATATHIDADRSASSDTKKWAAQIGVNGKTIRLGCFNSEKEASDAYLAAKKKHHPFQTIVELVKTEELPAILKRQVWI